MKNTYLVDYHIHTKLCNHATGEPEEYLKEAQKKNLLEIGFSDHAPLLPDATKNIRYSIPFEKITMPLSKIKHYINMIKSLSKKSKIPVKLGLETDFFPSTLSIFQTIKNFDFDYIIGSIHFVDYIGFDQEEFIYETEKYGYGRLIKKYLYLIRKMAETRLYDIVGHLDIPKKFGKKPGKMFDNDFRKTLNVIRLNRMAVEINTSGLDRKVKEIYPSLKLIKTCFELNIPVTLGSDAHRPEEVGRHFDEAKKILKKVGYNKIVLFKDHIQQIQSIV